MTASQQPPWQHHPPPSVNAQWRSDPAWWSRIADGLAIDVAADQVRWYNDQPAWRPIRPEDRDRAILISSDDPPRVAILSSPHATVTTADPDWVPVRSVVTAADSLLVTAIALAQWHQTHPYCAQCGHQTVISAAGWERQCPSCATTWFPRIDPAVIVLVRDDADRILLGRRSTWPSDRFSTFAGFVEAGESLETTMRREVAEESGIVIDRTSFLTSQAWPFPRSLMVGFHAWTSDPSTAQADGLEIVDVRWWTRAELTADLASGNVQLPPPSAISRYLIERWRCQGTS